ncbi:trimethylamine methyltransferase family protein [Desulfobacula sp.]|uniref:trimethylamine methyltransferase family protein n=1 Tax=Desulfobacula sp. TaxID=2593537 RepID=UPI00261CD422|nr:trimethylamine methyltransferase family protein [Desulfobacula sp.]
MNSVVSNFDEGVLDKINTSSLELLNETGIRFPNKEALELFKHHGFKTQGEMVFFQDTDIEKALKTVPDRFELHARNKENSFVIGDNSYRMAPGYGPPFIIEPSGEMRQSVLEDTHKFCKLVQTSKALDFNSSIVAHPNDMPPETAHLDMLLSTMLLTDKPLMGSTSSKQCAQDSLEMARIIWGNTDKPVMLNLVDSLSPLQYAQEMIDALMVYAKAGQPLIVHSSCSLGSSGPITIAGSLVISNACNLAGICLAQLINPGTPIVYGLGGSPTDMKTGGYINASPEDAKHTAIVTALSQYYNIPCRSQGALTESFSLDYQAGMEASMMLSTAALSGVHISLHACGTYGSMLAMSFEKFLADEDLCCAIKTLVKPIEFSEDAFAMDLIKKLGTSGTYLLESHTAIRCRSEFFIPDLNIRTIHSKWLEMDPRQMDQRASQLLEKRLSEYQKPDIDPAIENDLIKYLEMKKK